MKIAVVGPSPVPFIIGGVEGLLMGLVQGINKYSEHQAELIKLPSRELSFWELIDTYYQFYNLDLSHFDMVISTKYPAWMVKHKNHVCYVQHHLRGLYDTYHFSNEKLTIERSKVNGVVEEILEIIENSNHSDASLKKVFELLKRLKIDAKSYDKDLFKFPGSFIRLIIHFFDDCAISPEKIRRYYCISTVVQKRKDYFPENVNVTAIPHPSPIPYFKEGAYDYIFTISRLDAPKRIDLLINAMEYVSQDIKFKIAGTGPQEDLLKKLSKNDDRIDFLGFVNDEELIALYSNALVVLYVPYDEDFGLITIEAMTSKKPVITTKDSGGPTEFVENNHTGFVVNTDPNRIAEKINYFIENRNEAKRMGYNGFNLVKDITWKNTILTLLGERDAERGAINIKKSRKKILVLTTYSIYPPRGGGQHRLYNLYKNLSKHFDITVLSIIEYCKNYSDRILRDGLREICIPQSKEHGEKQWEIEKKTGLDLFDVAMIENVPFSKNYLLKVDEFLFQSDIIIFSHPYLFDLVKRVNEKQIIIYEAHNAEYNLKKQYLEKSKIETDLANQIRDIEEKACKESDIIFATSNEERKELSRFYEISMRKIFIVPNGVDTHKISFIAEEEHEKQKVILNIVHPTILFVGSWHPPNLEAMEFIVNNLARRNKNWIFLIIGSIKEYYIASHHLLKNLPENVLTFGVVEEDEKYVLYKAADVAINPMFSGSGTNMKMLDYMSAGVPIVSTQIGARGLELVNKKEGLVCNAESVSENIKTLLEDHKLKAEMRKNARAKVEKLYDWEVIAEKANSYIKSVLKGG